MPMFDRPNLDLAQRFMSGGQRPGPNAARFPNMEGFSQTPAGQELMARVLRNLRSRYPQRMPLSNTGRRP